jgi:polyhydroxybutyrate depolymerase
VQAFFCVLKISNINSHDMIKIECAPLAELSFDGTKIYATGISNGGFMSSRLCCELSNRIAAIAVYAATIEATTIASSCNPGRPVPAIYIHGTFDPLVPFTGGQMTAGGTAGGTVL